MFVDTAIVFRDDLSRRLGAAFREWIAVDADTGAFVVSSRGRARAGTGHNYVIVLPGESFAQRGFDYFAPYDHARVLYARFKAFSDAEALAKANARLPKLERRRGASR